MKAGALHAAFRTLPLAECDEIVRGTAMILAPHPDDESLGCGGLIASLCDAGWPPLVVIVTDGAGSHPGSKAWPAPRLAAKREAEAQAAVGLLGLPPERLSFLRLPDTRAPREGAAFNTALETLSALAADFDCTTLLSTWPHDPHGDHQASWHLATTLAARDGFDLLAYPVWGWLIPAEQEVAHGPPAGWRLDITRWMAVKAAAIRAHESQYGDLITDDPNGFRLPRELLAAFETPFELFLKPDGP